MTVLLILRPEPGASDTVARAAAMGIEAVKAPIFAVAPVDWEPPDVREFDAIMLTSAHAALMGGDELRRFTHLHCYCVGEATAAAARKAGFEDVRVGPSDGEALAAMMAADGIGQALHLCGYEHLAVEAPGVEIVRRIVYAAEPGPFPPAAAEMLAGDTLVVIHSPRAGDHFAKLTDAAGIDRALVSVAAISPSAAEAAGPGWGEMHVAERPRDEALLELAAKLCDNKDEGVTERAG
jgi:uroporphyrinogen-III synthase